MQKFTEGDLCRAWREMKVALESGDLDRVREVYDKITLIEVQLIVQQGSDVAQIAWDA
jgi:hypothetical protein